MTVTVIGLNNPAEEPLSIALMEKPEAQILHIAGTLRDNALCGADLQSWQFIQYRRNLATSERLFDLATTGNRCPTCVAHDRLPF